MFLGRRPERKLCSACSAGLIFAFSGFCDEAHNGTVSEPTLDPILGSSWGPESAYFGPEAVQDGFQTVLRGFKGTSEGGPKMVPKMDRRKIGRKSKTGQPTTLGGRVQRPRGGIKGGVNPSLEDRKVGIGGKLESGKKAALKPPVAQRAGGIFDAF